MIGSITLGQYLKIDSFIHKLDPRIKIILNIVYIIGIFLVDNIFKYIFYLVMIFLITLCAKIKFYYVLNSIKTVSLFIIFTAFFNIFFIKDGNLIFKLGFLTIYDNAIITSILISLRVIFLILGSTILILTTSPVELTDGFESMMYPLRKFNIPISEISLMMGISLRFIPILLNETDKIIKAQKSRGVDFEHGSIIKRVKNIVPILIPLFINSFRRADELAIAMESRCYNGSENRFKFKILKLNIKDYISSILFVLFVIFIYFL
ncbi:energy-coupling factor transporter transmembrane component T family protein [Candidatus Arthromitus sp. SFB-rat-Yit]|uniref:energy-coupling factor transporter transmembrane component T family protein n=1 Tax=Candidatus Arthromitus sp. SFB-rat-Yit TaxID=1041504 RepID=UPI000227A78F|nr:energy-coupling factor transporter transmembrane component T [Candidatus Arthromitus sp. SFB-rat-Yit]BAK81755.1 cobalt ABC transporter, permease protein [Candidatus Arthromitus sp. SFB-rat-Yit]